MKKLSLLFAMAAILTACGNEQGQSLVLENSTTTQSQEVDQQSAGDQATENSETEARDNQATDADSEASGEAGSEAGNQASQGSENSQEGSQPARRSQESQANQGRVSSEVSSDLSLETEAGQIQEKTETEQTVIEEIADRLDRSVEGVFYFGPVEVTSGVFEVEVRSTNPSDSNTSNLIGIYRLDRNSDTLYELDYATGEYVEVN